MPERRRRGPILVRLLWSANMRVLPASFRRLQAGSAQVCGVDEHKRSLASRRCRSSWSSSPGLNEFPLGFSVSASISIRDECPSRRRSSAYYFCSLSIVFKRIYISLFLCLFSFTPCRRLWTRGTFYIDHCFASWTTSSRLEARAGVQVL
jgi:hypothetical protein